MRKELLEELKGIIEGDVETEQSTLDTHSHDASIFEVMPEVVVFPKNGSDVEKLVKFVNKNKKENPSLSLAARAAGTDMSGGPLNDSIVVSFSKYFNHTPTVFDDYAVSEPGVFYRDFEAETLKKNMIFPSYPASRMICAIGGIVNNNSGGEKTLKYGKTENYVRKVQAVLSDGNTYEIKPLDKLGLKKKMEQMDFEGEIYRKMFKLVTENKKLVQNARPTVTKNSAGYNLWDIWNEETEIFNLTKLWVGSQGTLGMMLSAEIGLVPVHKHRAMVIIQLDNMDRLGEIINTVLPMGPESFESYDDNTLKLALKYLPEFSKKLGVIGVIQAAFAFLPSYIQMLTGNLPKLVLQVDFTGDDAEELKTKTSKLVEILKPFGLKTQVAVENEEEKYWMVRRESFNLLRSKIRERHTAPFIDDIVIDPQKIQTVLPEVTKILSRHPEFIFTVAGHVGEGNFHIIPLIDIKDKKVRDAIPVIAEEVYKVVLDNGGSTNGEHNDGLIRTPYLDEMFGDQIVKLFEETKDIFDPKGIFNPRKKVHGDMKFAMSHLREKW